MFSFYLTNSKKKKETAQIIIKTQIYLITCEVTRENVQKKKKIGYNIPFHRRAETNKIHRYFTKHNRKINPASGNRIRCPLLPSPRPHPWFLLEGRSTDHKYSSTCRYGGRGEGEDPLLAGTFKIPRHPSAKWIPIDRDVPPPPLPLPLSRAAYLSPLSDDRLSQSQTTSCRFYPLIRGRDVCLVKWPSNGRP